MVTSATSATTEPSESSEPPGGRWTPDRPSTRLVPTWTEPLAAAASTVIGGPLGRHAVVGRSRFWTPLRVLLLAAVLTLAAGWLVKAPCLQQEPGPDSRAVLDWDNGRQYLALCYSDIVTMPTEDRLLGAQPPYAAHWNDPSAPAGDQVRYLDYPVVTGYALWIAAKLTLRYQAAAGDVPWRHGLPTGLTEVVFFILVAAAFAALWLVVVWAVHRSRPGWPWDAALVALSPLALLHVFTGTDALGVAGVAVALYLFARGRPVGAGALLGLAAAAKFYAVLPLLALLLVGRRRRESGPALRAAIAAGTVWFVVDAPVAVVLTPGWLEQFRAGLRGGPEPDSIWFALSYFTRWPGFDGQLAPGQTPVRLNLLVLALLLAAVVGVVLLAWRAPVPPRVASVAFLLVAGALLVNKSWSPQFSLWLVPLAVLALPRWRLLLAWMTVDALVWVPRMFFYLGEDERGLPADPFLVVVLLRDAMVVALAVLVVRSVLRPETDPLRAGGTDPDWPTPAWRSPVPAEPALVQPVLAEAATAESVHAEAARVERATAEPRDDGRR
jgi:uncharacterized membrane protein